MESSILASVRLPLIVANNVDDISDIEVATFIDPEDSNARFLSNALGEPFSPLSGRVLKAVSEETAVIDAQDVEGLLKVATCTGCDCEIRASAELAALFESDDFKCIICGSDLHGEALSKDELVAHFEEEFAGKKDHDDDDDDMDKDMDDDSCDPDTASLRNPTDAPDFDASHAADPVLVEDPASPTATDKPRAVPVADPALAAADPGAAADPVTVGPNTAPGPDKPAIQARDPSARPLDPANNIGAPGHEEGTPAESHPETTISPPAVHATVALTANVDWTQAEINLVRVSAAQNPKYYVFCNDTPVALLKKEKASEEVQSIFSTDTLIKAFIAAARQGLSAEDEKSFGLEPITSEISVDEHLKTETDKEIAKAKETMQAELEKFKNAHLQSVSIAIASSIKGLDNTKNPLRDGLIATLAKNGVHDPEHIVDSAFLAHSKEFFQTVLTKANELLSKSDDVRNELAQMVASASFRTGVDRSVQEASLAETLANGSIPTVELVGTSKPGQQGFDLAPAAHTATASVGMSSQDAIRSKLRLADSRLRRI